MAEDTTTHGRAITHKPGPLSLVGKNASDQDKMEEGNELLSKAPVFQERLSELEDVGKENGANDITAVFEVESTPSCPRKENVVLSIARQSVSPLSHFTPNSSSAVSLKHLASSGKETPDQFYDAISSPSLGDDGNSWRSSLLLPEDRTTDLRDTEKLDQNQSFEGEYRAFRHDLSSPASFTDSRVQLLAPSETDTHMPANMILLRNTPEIKPVGSITNNPRAMQLFFGGEESAVDSVEPFTREQCISVGPESQPFSPCDSDSFDWRDEASPIVQAKYKSKRRSSIFLVHQRPSRLLESPSPSPVANCPETPPGLAKENNTPRKPMASTEEINHETGNTKEAATPEFRLPLHPGFPANTTASLEDSEDSDGSVDEIFLDEITEGELLLLEPIYEGEDKLPATNSQSSEQIRLVTNCKKLENDNKRLRERLQSKSKTYDFQIGPFRHAFEALPTLREENRSLRRENADLKEGKAELEVSVNETVQQLQSQMMNAVKVAVEKTSLLQAELQARNSRINELEGQLAHLRAAQTGANDSSD